MASHQVMSSPETVRWGVFDAQIPPVLTVQPGDTVTMHCVTGGPEVMPPPGSAMQVPPVMRQIHERVARQGAHIITGPVAIAGAEPGDMLEVRIDAIAFGTDWGFCGFRALAGTLPEDFPERFLMHIPIDRARNTCRLPFAGGATELALAPFFGVMGVAPPPAYGAINTKEPREHGGNLDNKELTAGSTLFLPVFVPGANFSAGDGHGVQGDGEVCINALETFLTGTFTFWLHKGGGAHAPLLRMPRAETGTHYISMGMNEDLDLAMKQALREMIGFICGRTNLSRQEAYAFCSLAVDFHVTQTVNGEKGVHGLLRKGLLF
jgi:acetamidase/formamidase